MNSDEVRIRVAAAGICRTDIMIASGQIPVASNRILGHELSGIVIESTSDLHIGDKVSVVPFVGCGSCLRCEQKRDELCPNSQMLGMALDGAFADELIVPSRLVVKVAPNMDMIVASLLEPAAAALAVRKAISPTQVGLILGDNRIAQLTLRVLNAAGINQLRIETPDSISSNSVDFVVEAEPSSKIIEAAIEALRPGGCLVIKSRTQDELTLPLVKIINKEIQLVAVRYGSFDQAQELLSSLTVDDLIGPIHPLENYENAFNAAQNDREQKHFFDLGGHDVWNC